MIKLPFRDRSEAGRLLGMSLAKRGFPENTIVLGLPRGGVVVAAVVANILRAPLDFVMVRKLGVPWQPELAMGAIAGGRIRILDQALIEDLGVTSAEVDAVVLKEMDEIERRERLYRSERLAPDLHEWTVILVDDGLATGSTMLAAVHYVDSFRPAKVIVAVPVGSAQACRKFESAVDECVCLATPEPFVSVGAWYSDFHQTTDMEVQQLLAQNRRQMGPVLKTVSLGGKTVSLDGKTISPGGKAAPLETRR